MHSSLFAENLKLPFYKYYEYRVFSILIYSFFFNRRFPGISFLYKRYRYTVLYCEFIFYSPRHFYSNLVISHLPRRLPLSLLLLVNDSI